MHSEANTPGVGLSVGQSGPAQRSNVDDPLRLTWLALDTVPFFFFLMY